MADEPEKWSEEDQLDDMEFDSEALDGDALVSEEAFDAALDALGADEAFDTALDSLDANQAGEFDQLSDSDAADELDGAIPYSQTEPAEGPFSTEADDALREDQELAAIGETERLRSPRAVGFRRRLQRQVSVLPLALFLIALGAYLLARERDVRDLPDLSTLALGIITILAVGFTFIFHSIVFGRRERGLLFWGIWIWLTAAVIAFVMLGIDDAPDASAWWPLLLVSMGLAFVATYIIERLHDARLLLMAATVLATSAIAFVVTNEVIEQAVLDDVVDYWPLLFSVLGLGLLPLVFRRRAGSG